MLFRFADCSLDPARRELRLGGALVTVEPQVFDLIEFLVRQRDHVVSRDQLIENVWRGRIVSESTLATANSGSITVAAAFKVAASR